MKVNTPKYQQIAADLAGKISRGEFPEGEKIYIRSSLVSQYGVSSETARRAVCVLEDMNIVQITKGSGVIIKSRKEASNFIKRFDFVSKMSDLKKSIMDNVEQQLNNSAELKTMVSELMYKTERFRNVNLFSPFKIEITEQASCLNQNLSDCNFWHNTSATIIAIMRDENFIISPGPYAEIKNGDTLYYIGDEECHERVRNFLYLSS